ncbi:MAG: PQQ-binding-like beta-propeller repeat protein [Planctomycetes bacterium]|nr:PQQ-binding-like beta-propeller repeat protein [Planctomycetota bacterium]
MINPNHPRCLSATHSVRAVTAVRAGVLGGVLAVGAVCGMAGMAWGRQPAVAPQQRGVYPDDSVVAKDALLRVKELHEAGNTGEALRVLQGLLETDADKLLASAADPDVFYPVRRHVQEMLLANPELLTKYREREEPQALALLTSGDIAGVERTRLMCPSGFEAALRMAQLELEAARFESARLVLEQLDRHPDRAAGSPKRADAARLAGLVAAYIGRPATREWAQRWANDAGLDPKDAPPPVAAAAASRRPSGVTPLMQMSAPAAPPAATPLQSAVVDKDAADRAADPQIDKDSFGAWRFRDSSWVFPTVAGGVVYATDGVHLSAWDAATLGPLWQAKPANAPASFSWGSDEALQFTISGGKYELEDVASVAVGGGVAITATGLPYNGQRTGDKRVHAFDAVSGTPLWSIETANLDQRVTGQRDTSSACVVRGPVVIDADTAVLALRKPGPARRITSLYLAGVDLYSGDVKWVRLVGAYGTNPWGRNSVRPEAMVVDRGVVYRCDDMGVTGAYEAATGRPVWVRLAPTKANMEFTTRGEDSRPPFTMHAPVIDGDSMYAIEPAFQRIVQLSLADGSLRASREGSAMFNPWYLLKVGDWLCGVGEAHAAFVQLSDLAGGSVKSGSSFARSAIVGRAFAAGGMLYAPLADGLAVVDPSNPTEATRIALTVSGNPVIAPEADGVGAHLLIADKAHMHTFVRWEDARALLDRRVAQRPNDAAPLLIYAQLAHRTGKSELIPGLADRALSILDKSAVSEAAAVTRTRLFDLLMEMVAQSRAAWGQVAGESTEDASKPRPINDTARLDEILDRAARAADTPPQRAAALFERAWLRGVQKRWPQAVEAVQEVLLEDAMADVQLPTEFRDPKTDSVLPSAVTNAHAKAAAVLAGVLRDAGPTAYAAFDEEAQRELGRLPEDAEAARATLLAKRYPVAAVTPELWRRAASAWKRAGRLPEAQGALGSALSAAEFSHAIGRPGQEQVVAIVMSELLPLATGPNDAEPMYRLLRRLQKDYPGLAITGANGSTTPKDAADALSRTLASRTALPRVGATPGTAGVQALAAWEPVAPLSRGAAGSSGGSVVMISTSVGQVALWAVAAEDGKLRQVWTRPFEERPTLVRLTPDTTVLFWPTPSGGYAEAISNVGGQGEVGATKWKTQEFGGLFAPVERADPQERFQTPLDGGVRPDDLIVLCDGKTLGIVQRRGRVAAFDMSQGKTMWSRQLDLPRVFEAEICGQHVLVGGSLPQRAVEGKWMPAVSVLSMADGSEKTRLNREQLGDHPRWIREVDAGGDAIICTAEGLMRYNPANSAIVWSLPGAPGQASVGGWVVGGGLFVLTPDRGLWRVSLADGTVQGEQINTMGKLQLPMSVRAANKRLLLCSSSGLLVVDEHGGVIGADALDHDATHIEAPEPGDSVFVAMEQETRVGEDVSAEESTLRLFVFGNPSGKLMGTHKVRLYDSPQAITLIDGKIIIPAGAVTLVVDAPLAGR